MPSQTSSSYPVRSQTGVMGGLGQTLVTGMAFGAGSAIAHEAVRSVIGGGHGHGNNVGEAPQQQVQNDQQFQQNNEIQQQKIDEQKNICLSISEKFVSCLKEHGNDISDCQHLFNDLKSCEKGIN
jgi:hypothetical protein